MAHAPDGWFLGNLLYFGSEPDRPAWIARGARVRLPDLRQASARFQEERYTGFQSFLSGLQPGECLQVQWSRECDYADELERYRAVSRESRADGWCLRTREERARRYERRLADGTLRRERVEIYLARRLAGSATAGRAAEAVFSARLGQEARDFAIRFGALERALPGSRIRPLDDQGHFEAWRSFLQPGTQAAPELAPHCTILENCIGSDAVATSAPQVPGFLLDGRRQAVLVLRQWPQQTSFATLRPLLECAAGDLRVTLCARPVDAAELVRREEDDIRRLEGQAGTERKPSLLAVAARKRQRVAELQNGSVHPFMALLVVRVWDVTDEGLAGRVAALKTAIAGMAGARCHHADQPAQAKNLFFETLPGWMGGGYRAWDRVADSTFLPDLAPLSASFEGDISEGHALYDGAHGGLVGVSGFPGGTPAHGLVIGMTRAGKSSLVIDYLSQTDCLMRFRAIIEEGFSYGTAVELLGGKPVLLRADGDLTLNPFDTQGCPLGRLHLGSVASLLLMMAGSPADADCAARRKAMLSDYIQQIYDDAFSDWSRRNPARSDEVARWSLTLASAELAALPAGDAFERARARCENDPEEFRSVLAAHDPEALLRHVCAPGARARMRELACAFYGPEDFPRLGGLWELVRFDPMPHHRREDVEQLAVMLSAWTAGGPYGRFFDGVSNMRLDDRLVHFELGSLPRTARELKCAALYHVFNYTRQRVTGLPRSWRKEIVLEEPARYLGDAGVEEMLEECYAQLGKYGCRLLPVTQQYAQLARSRVRPVVLGNSSQFLLLRQNERRDLDDLSNDVDLPETLREAILAFPRPGELPSAERHSCVALVGKAAGGAACGVFSHRSSPEMTVAAESSGEIFDRLRAVGTASAGEALERVLREAGISTPGSSPEPMCERTGLRADREGSASGTALDSRDGGLGDRPSGGPGAEVHVGAPGVSHASGQAMGRTGINGRTSE